MNGWLLLLCFLNVLIETGKYGYYINMGERTVSPNPLLLTLQGRDIDEEAWPSIHIQETSAKCYMDMLVLLHRGQFV